MPKREILPDRDAAPPRAITRQDAVERAEARVRRRLPKLLKVMEELAFGIYVEETLPDGTTRLVYQKPPSRQALEYLIDRGMGKPPTHVEVTGADSGPVQVIPWLPKGVEVPLLEDGKIIEGEVVVRE